MNKLDIAKKLALITGKPVADFFDGEINNEQIEKTNDEDTCGESFVENVDEIKSNPISSDKENKKQESWSEEVIAFQKMFAGSKILNKYIMGGRQMTKKEYLKYTKSMTEAEYYKHPLMYKIFRAEGQNHPQFTSFPDRFKKNENKK